MFNKSKGFKIEQWKLNEHDQNKYKQCTCVVPKLRQAVGRLGQALVRISSAVECHVSRLRGVGNKGIATGASLNLGETLL